MFGNEARACLRLAARRCRRRLHQYLNLAAVGDPEHTEAEAPAEIAIARIALAPLAARRHFCSDPDFVAGRCAVDRLQNQFEIECELELANHNHGRIAGAQANKIAAANLALHGEAELLEEAFDGKR